MKVKSGRHEIRNSQQSTTLGPGLNQIKFHFGSFSSIRTKERKENTKTLQLCLHFETGFSIGIGIHTRYSASLILVLLTTSKTITNLQSTEREEVRQAEKTTKCLQWPRKNWSRRHLATDAVHYSAATHSTNCNVRPFIRFNSPVSVFVLLQKISSSKNKSRLCSNRHTSWMNKSQKNREIRETIKDGRLICLTAKRNEKK